MRVSFKQKVLAVLALTFAVSLGAAGGNVYSASATTDCALTMRDGASVRIGNSLKGTGIRFSADINTNILNITDTENHVAEFKNVEEVGMIIVPAYTLENVGNADIFTYLQTTYSAPKEEISTQFTSQQIQWDKDGYYVAGAIVQIQDENIGLDYQAIPYTWDGKNYTYGNESEKRSISYVFNAALNDTKAEAMAQKPSVLAKAIEMDGKLDIETELFVREGGDLSNYAAEGYVISSVSLAGTEVAVSNNEIAGDVLQKEMAKKDPQPLTITYAAANGSEQQTLNVNAQVWSMQIKNADDLIKKLGDYAYYKAANIGGTLVEKASMYGYYKVVDDIEMDPNSVDYSITGATGYGIYAKNDGGIHYNKNYGFQGVLEGDGHTIDKLWVRHRSLFGVVGANAVFKNINFTNVKFSPISTGSDHSSIFGSYVNGGTFENVSVAYNIPNNMYTISTAPASCGVLFGQLYLDQTNISKVVLKNVTITALNAATTTNENWAALGVIKSDCPYLANSGIPFITENVNIVGGGIYGTFNPYTLCTTAWDGLTFTTGK